MTDPPHPMPHAAGNDKLKIFSRILGVFYILSVIGCGGSGGSSGGNTCAGTSSTVGGKATFEFRETAFPSGTFNGGFTGVRTQKPIRFADVEVIKNSDSSVIASSATDGSGFYCIEFVAPDTDLYVRVSAKTNHPNYNLRVNNLGDTSIYSIRSGVFNDSTNTRVTQNLLATVGAGVAGAFNILDVFERGVDFSTQLTGGVPPLLRGRWTVNNDPGTGFSRDPNGYFIQINGGGDPDEYDEGVLLHEFGHFMAEVYSKDSSPGGPHSGLDNTQDIRLSFSEGWASFISGVIRKDRFILDVLAGDPPNNGFAFILDLEATPDSVKDLEIYTTNELAVAKVLWDMYDSDGDPEPFDGMGVGFTPIWDVMVNYLKSVSVVSMESFWEGWFLRGHNYLTSMEDITMEFKMEFLEDVFEGALGGDNNPNNLRKFIVNSTPEDHTIYPNGDMDYIGFNADAGFQYTIGTSGLKNGADTFIEIFGPDQVTVVASNDNRDGTNYLPSCGVNCPPNDQTTLSSQVIFTASQTGVYYAVVKRSPSAPPSAGRFGSYKLLITSP